MLSRSRLRFYPFFRSVWHPRRPTRRRGPRTDARSACRPAFNAAFRRAVSQGDARGTARPRMAADARDALSPTLSPDRKGLLAPAACHRGPYPLGAATWRTWPRKGRAQVGQWPISAFRDDAADRSLSEQSRHSARRNHRTGFVSSHAGLRRPVPARPAPDAQRALSCRA